VTVYSDLINTDITSSSGVPAGYSDWRYVIQIAKPSGSALLGTMILGTDLLSELGWIDVTTACHGVEFQRGNNAGTRPGAGKISFWLKNDNGDHDVTQRVYHGPGTLIRVVLGTSVATGTLFTGFTVEWNELSDANNQSRWVAISAYETISLLSEVDNNALSSPIGDDDTITQRIDRIVTASAEFPLGWTYQGLTMAEPQFSWHFQSTDMAQDCLTQLYSAVDSVSLVARSNKQGKVVVTSQALAATANSDAINYTGGLPVVADSIMTANDDDRLIGSVDVSRVGGSAVTYTNTGIQGRYQKRSTNRTDLSTKNPGANQDLALYASTLLGQAGQTYRVTQFQVDSLRGALVWAFLQAVDVGTTCNIKLPKTATTGVLFLNYRICGYTMNIQPLQPGTIRITATLETDTIDATSTYAAYEGSLWDEFLWDEGVWA
jgi:hypothetical protein